MKKTILIIAGAVTLVGATIAAIYSWFLQQLWSSF